MDATIHALGRILLNSVPTFLLVSFLILFLRGVFFGPLARISKQRYEESEGAQRAAEESLRQAERRVAEYEEKLRAARGEIYAAQDRVLKELGREHASQIEHARRDAEILVARTGGELREEAEEAKRTLEARSQELADLIVSRVLEDRAA